MSQNAVKNIWRDNRTKSLSDLVQSQSELEELLLEIGGAHVQYSMAGDANADDALLVSA